MSTKEFLKVSIDLSSNLMCSRLLKYLKKAKMIYIYLRINNMYWELNLKINSIIITQVIEHLSFKTLKIIKIMDKFQNLKIIMLS
jgi:hypothetical protein